MLKLRVLSMIGLLVCMLVVSRVQQQRCGVRICRAAGANAARGVTADLPTGLMVLSPVDGAVNLKRQRRTSACALSAGYVPVRNLGESFNPVELRYLAPTSRF